VLDGLRQAGPQWCGSRAELSKPALGLGERSDARKVATDYQLDQVTAPRP